MRCDTVLPPSISMVWSPVIIQSYQSPKETAAGGGAENVMRNGGPGLAACVLLSDNFHLASSFVWPAPAGEQVKTTFSNPSTIRNTRQATLNDT